MTADEFTKDVFPLIEELRHLRKENPKDFVISDLVDEEGNQYVNLVQEGGGVLGIALVGFTYVLEEMGIRFISMGGTSAGSINTLMLADLGRPDEAKSLRILNHIANKDFKDFVDGGSDANSLVKAILNGNIFTRVIAVIRNVAEFKRLKGFNPGSHFLDWLKSVTNFKTWEDLETNMNNFGLRMYRQDDYGNRLERIETKTIKPKLAIVAADISTQSKVDFPGKGHLYYAEPKKASPADAVRASMSIPLFFEPFKIDLSWSETCEEDCRRAWAKDANFTGRLPKEAVLVDGGMMSNFPIDLFHEEGRIPDRPTIGIKLGVDRGHAKDTSSLMSYLYSMVDGVRNLRDHEFISNNPQYRETVSYVNVDGFDWLDFNLPDDQKKALFMVGAKTACEFLRNFKWPRYQAKLKRELLQKVKPLMWELSNVNRIEQVLENLGIRNDDDCLYKVKFLRSLDYQVKVLWIDDAFTYVLLMAILDQLNIDTLTCKGSTEALDILKENNFVNQKKEDRIHLVISDLTRKEGDKEEEHKVRGLDFAQMVNLNTEIDDVDFLIYVHTPESLREKYGKDLPSNVVNSPNRNTMRHSDFVREVVDALYNRLNQDSSYG
ncbi:MAG: patatin-like phospholipase family protein [Bacteroidota bacterium]